MVTFEETITHFKSRKTNEKNIFIDNVHKAIEAYRCVNKNYENLDIMLMYQNINEYFIQLKQNFSSMTTKTYIKFINQAIDEPIIKDNVDESVLTYAKTRIIGFIKIADKDISNQQKKSNVVINNDNPIISTDNSIISTENDTIKVKYEAELLHLRDENTWLRNLVMQITTNK